MTRFYVNAAFALLWGQLFGWAWGVGFFTGFIVYMVVVFHALDKARKDEQ